MMADNTPFYNLKAVINEVGLSPATLRAWERRYGLLKPTRTAGGHRLYSRQDIEMLKWLVERQNEGLSISRAVEMWKGLRENERRNVKPIPSPVPVSGMGETIMDELQNGWLAACMVFDDQAANRVLDQAFSIAAPETTCAEVLQKGLSQIGDRWYARSVSVQQEHFVSAIAIRRLNALLAVAIPPTRSGHILAANPPGEEHEFPLLLTSYLLRRRGWDVVYLGTNVPLDNLDITIQSTSPVLIVSSAQTLSSAASLRKMSEYVALKGVPLAYGGGIFNQIPAVVQSISGYYLGTEIAGVTQIVERLITTPPPMPEAQPVSPQFSQTLRRFLQQEALIAGFVASITQVEPFEPAHMEIAIPNFTRLVASALELGDINYLDTSIKWLLGLLSNYGISASLARKFYAVYNQTVGYYLGQDGEIIQAWLTKQIQAE